MSINSQFNTITVTHHSNGRMIELPDPAAYHPAAIKSALDDYLEAAKRSRASSASAEPQEANELEAECAKTWDALIAALNEHQGRTRTRAAAGRRDAAKRLRELVDAVEDAAVDYIANTLIEKDPARYNFPRAWRSDVPGALELNLGLDGNGEIGGIRQALDALNGS